MEDFQAAFFQRSRDVIILHEQKRYIASMHMGGVAVECLLKAMLSATLPLDVAGKREWYDRNGKNNPGHKKCNPGHSLTRAIQTHDHLYSRVKHNQCVLNWVRIVENPGCHFIDMRYVGEDPTPEKYESWHNAYIRLIGWLCSQKL